MAGCSGWSKIHWCVCVLKETSCWHTNQWVTLHRQLPELLVEPLNYHILDTFSPYLQPCSTVVFSDDLVTTTVQRCFKIQDVPPHQEDTFTEAVFTLCNVPDPFCSPPRSSDLALCVQFLWVSTRHLNLHLTKVAVVMQWGYLLGGCFGCCVRGVFAPMGTIVMACALSPRMISEQL